MSARERPVKRFRRLSTDSSGDSPVDYEMRPAQAERQQSNNSSSKMSNPNMSRSRRPAPNHTSEPMATVSRGPAASSSSTHRASLNLTVKLPASKLREATSHKGPSSSRSTSGTTNPRNEKMPVNSRDQFVGGEIIEGKRARNVKKSYVLESESDDDDEDAEGEDDDAEMEDAEGESEDEDAEGEDEDAEGEDEDAEGDIDMDAPPPPPTIKVSKAPGKSIISARPSGRSDGKSVEQKEAGSDDDLSELDSDVEEDEGMQVDNEEDVEGEEDAEGEDEELEIAKDEDEDSDEETRESTPNISQMTKRQRARFEEGGSGHLMALPDEVQVKKHLTAEEHAMRRAEMARRRKNLSEKRNEEEKMETINKLLKKQAPKTNARRANLGKDKDEVAVAGENGNSDEGDYEPKKADPVFVRWVSNQQGVRLGVPEEWLGKDVGRVFGKANGVGGVGLGTGRLIEEVE